MEGTKEGEWNHFWLQSKDGTVVDPTADQFGGPAVYVGPVVGMYEKGEPASLGGEP